VEYKCAGEELAGLSGMGSPSPWVSCQGAQRCGRDVPEVEGRTPGVMEPELPLPMTDPWWQSCPGLESFLHGDMKWGEGLAAFGLPRDAVLDSNATLARDDAEHPPVSLQLLALSMCGSLRWLPWGGVALQPPPNKAGTAVMLHN